MGDLPVYEKIIDYIKEQIENGFYKPNQKLPTEAELSEMFNTSRTTVIKAMNTLDTQGIIYRKQGKGSFVSDALLPKNQSRNRLVSLILPFSNNERPRIGELDIIRGAESYLKSKGYYLTVHYVGGGPDEEMEVIQRCKNEMSDVVIVYPTTIVNNLPFLYNLILDDYPIVFMGKNVDNLDITSVQSDNKKGGAEATKFLLDKGYEEIFFVSDSKPELVSSVRDRYFGYLKAIKETKKAVDPDMFISGYAMKGMEYKAESYSENPQLYRDILNNILRKCSDKRVGVFAINDMEAISLIYAAMDMGIKIPDRMGIIGFDDTEYALRSPIPLTTVKQNFFEIGRLSAKAVIDKILNAKEFKKNILVDVKVIERDSAK